MPTYVTLARWTHQGIQNVKESPARLDAYRKLLRSLGGELKGFYMVMGQYDMVLITEAPNAEVAAKAALMTASKGSITTETLPAFTEDEYRKVIGSVS